MSYNELFEEIHLTQEESRPNDTHRTPDLRHVLKFLNFDGKICISLP